MKKIVIASENPVKIQASLNGFRKMFPLFEFEGESATVPSGVTHQPMTSRETLRGAMTRVDNAFKTNPDGEFWVGIEGGVEEIQGEMFAFAWIVVRSENQIGKSRTGSFRLPEEIAGKIRDGIELGDADDIAFARTNSKQQNGAIGILTNDLIDRTKLYEHGVVLALIPFKNVEMFSIAS